MPYRKSAKEQARLSAVRTKLLREASVLVDEGGFSALKISKLATNSQVATGTIYRHFDSRDALAAEVFMGFAKHEVTVFHQTLVDHGISQAIRRWCRRVLLAPTRSWALLVESVPDTIQAARLQLRQANIDILAQAIDRDIAANRIPKINSHVAATGLVGALASAAVHGQLDPGTDLDDLLAFCHRALGVHPTVSKAYAQSYKNIDQNIQESHNTPKEAT